MRTIGKLGLGERCFYVGLGLAFGLGFAVHGAAASSVSTPCRSGNATKTPVAVRVAPATHQAHVLVNGTSRWRLTLAHVSVVQEVRGALGTYHARGKYVVVVLDAQNVGKAAHSLYIDQDFALTDAQGRQFGTASGAADTAAVEQYKTSDPIDEVQPTFRARVAFVFDVARDAHGLTLVNVPLFGAHTQKLFSLGI